MKTSIRRIPKRQPRRIVRSGPSELFGHYRNEHDEVAEHRVSKSRAPSVRLYRLRMTKDTYLEPYQTDDGKWGWDIIRDGKRTRRTPTPMSTRERALSHMRMEGPNAERDFAKSTTGPYQMIGNERHYESFLALSNVDELEVIDLRDGRWTVLWAGLEYGPGPLKKILALRARMVLMDMVRKNEYVDVPSVASVLDGHYEDRPRRNAR